MENWKSIVVDPDTPVIEVMNVMNVTGKKIVLVADTRGKFLGVATDGNVRKGLTKHTSMDLKAVDVMNKEAVVVKDTAPSHLIKKKFNNPDIIALPIVNRDGHLCGCYFSEFFSKKSYEPARLLVMAGGYGKRMGRLTRDTPKPMLKVNGKPMLEYIIANAEAHGLMDITISIHFQQEKITDYFGDGSKFDVNIEYIYEKQPLGTAGCIKSLKLGDESLIVVNGDIISDIDYSSLLNYHIMMNAMATMATHEHEITNPYGVVDTNGINITSVQEKPTWTTNVNAGIYVFQPDLQSLIAVSEKIDMPDFFRRIINKHHKAIIYPLNDKPLEIGTKNQYAEATDRRSL